MVGIYMPALNTDLYELTMAAGFFAAGKAQDVATFELSVRRLPENRNFLIAAGLEQAVQYLSEFRFEREEIEYLRSLRQFSGAPVEFFTYLADLRFQGDVFAMPEGSPVFAGEPLLIVRAPLIQAQIVETFLLSTVAFQTTIASKAARCVIAAEGRSVVEFGSRRAHSPAAGPLAARAAYLAGCAGTSNAEAGLRYGIPVSGTAAHSWIMAFPSEEQAFRELQTLLGENTVYLIDTYDTLEGANLAARLGPPVLGVRLDSGDLVTYSRRVRQILDEAGLHTAQIMVTNDLNEHRIARLLSAGAPIDSFGVGTELSTSADAPALSAVYKLVELEVRQSHIYTAKYSDDKTTLPGAKQVYRCRDYDLIALSGECISGFEGEPLLRPVLEKGELVETYPSLMRMREKAVAAILDLPPELRSLDVPCSRRVEVSPLLRSVADELRTSRQPVIR
jgi:nicotinate phosphoribosyltransferase